MKKLILAIGLLLALAAGATGKIVYVIDKPDIHMRTGPSTQNKILRVLTPGAILTVLEEDKVNGYSRVSTEDDLEGWVLSRQVSAEPPSPVQMEAATRKMDSLLQENQELKSEVAALKKQAEESNNAKEDATMEAQRLTNEITLIRQASANTISLLEERNQLQEKSAALENEVENLRREKDTLLEKDSQDWFLKGAAVLFGGIVVGLIAPKLGGRRRQRWDTF